MVAVSVLSSTQAFGAVKRYSWKPSEKVLPMYQFSGNEVTRM